MKITCKCRVCKDNATRLGLTVLGANVPVALAAVAATPAGRHGLVHVANDPHPVTGAACRARTGLVSLTSAEV